MISWWALSIAAAAPPQFYLEALVTEVQDQELVAAVEAADPALLPLVAQALRVDPRVEVLAAPQLLANYGQTAEFTVDTESAGVELMATAERMEHATQLTVELVIQEQGGQSILRHQGVLDDGDALVLHNGETMVVLVPLHVESPAQLAVQARSKESHRLLVERLLTPRSPRSRAKRLDALLEQ